MPVYPDYSHGLATTMVIGQPVFTGRPRLEDLPSDRYKRVEYYGDGHYGDEPYIHYYGDRIDWIDKSTGRVARDSHAEAQHTAWVDPALAETHHFVPADPAYLGRDKYSWPLKPPRPDMELYYVNPPDNSTVQDPAPEQAVLAQGDASAARMSRNPEPVNTAVEEPRYIPVYDWNQSYNPQRDQPYDDGRRGTRYKSVTSGHSWDNHRVVKAVPEQNSIPPQRRYVDPYGTYPSVYEAPSLPEAMETFSIRGYGDRNYTPGEEIPYDTTVYYGRR